MSDEFLDLRTFRQPRGTFDSSAGLEIVIADTGCNSGIDVAIYRVDSGQVLFETVLVGPESRILLTHRSLETEAFWQCLKLYRHVHSAQGIFVTARCRFSPLKIATSTKHMGQAENRNMRFLRMVEAILEELQMREPGLAIQVAVTHRNPRFDHYFEG